MPKPPAIEFKPGSSKVLFFSRGRGRGHAVPDHVIAQELRSRCSQVDIRLVSYATGARTLEALGCSLIDLSLPEDPAWADVTVLAGKLIAWLQPDLVIAHEEFAALAAAKVFDKKTVCMTAWFSDPAAESMRALHYADRILFTDEPGIFEPPAWAEGKTRYVGPILRPFRRSLADRASARAELSIPQDATLISVLPGSWSEAQVPILDLILETFTGLPITRKRLLWLAAADFDLVRARVENDDRVLVLREEWEIDRIMVASNLAITKGSRMTLLELTQLGVPWIALLSGLNAMDARRAESMQSGQTHSLRGLTPPHLRHTIIDALRQPASPESAKGAVDRACGELFELLGRGKS